jgi:hypothetical protein
MDDDHDEGLRWMRGCLYGLAFSAVAWLAIAAIVCLLTSL